LISLVTLHKLGFASLVVLHNHRAIFLNQL
jgi:hypothetical protein